MLCSVQGILCLKIIEVHMYFGYIDRKQELSRGAMGAQPPPEYASDCKYSLFIKKFIIVYRSLFLSMQSRDPGKK